MKKTPAPKPSKAKVPRGRRGAKKIPADMNQATTDEFEREDMGIAAKE
jgi:hypothetical protein